MGALPRIGEYSIDEQAWPNPLPPHGLSAAKLAGFWSAVVGACIGGQRRRELAGEALSAAERAGDRGAAASLREFRYGGKIEIKSCESVVALLHRILEPATSEPCDHDCTHVASGATADQCKRFLDALDARAALLRLRESECDSRSDPCMEGYEGERYVCERWRAQLAELAGAAGPAAAPAEFNAKHAAKNTEVEVTYRGRPLCRGAQRQGFGVTEPETAGELWVTYPNEGVAPIAAQLPLTPLSLAAPPRPDSIRLENAESRRPQARASWPWWALTAAVLIAAIASLFVSPWLGGAVALALFVVGRQSSTR